MPTCTISMMRIETLAEEAISEIPREMSLFSGYLAMSWEQLRKNCGSTYVKDRK